MYSPDALEQRTYRYDRIRGTAQGIAQSGLLTFGLLIAIRVYEAPAFLKASIPAAHALGMLLSPLLLAVLSRTAWRSTGICAVFFVISALMVLLTSLAGGLIAFTLFITLALIAQSQQPPFMIQAYSMNYKPINRGSRLSTSFMLSALFGSIFLFAGGNILDANIDHWRLLFVLMAIASLGAAWAVFQIPSRAMDHYPRSNPLENLTLIKSDRVFGTLLISWTLLGMATLMTTPLRIEYLANPDYGINASNERIAMLTFIVPAISQIFSTRFWGRFYDRTNFIVLRNCINACFLSSILLFFTTTNLMLITLASIIFGIGVGGGTLVWNLWVTKMAPANRVQAYMSVHTWTTGVRGLIAPFIGFSLLTVISPTAIGILSAVLICLSMLLFITARGDPRLS